MSIVLIEISTTDKAYYFITIYSYMIISIVVMNLVIASLMIIHMIYSYYFILNNLHELVIEYQYFLLMDCLYVY
jgi:uncharacterized membrane protein YukC